MDSKNFTIRLSIPDVIVEFTLVSCLKELVFLVYVQQISCYQGGSLNAASRLKVRGPYQSSEDIWHLRQKFLLNLLEQCGKVFYEARNLFFIFFWIWALSAGTVKAMRTNHAENGTDGDFAGSFVRFRAHTLICRRLSGIIMQIFPNFEKISVFFQATCQLLIFVRKNKWYLIDTIVFFIQDKLDKISVAENRVWGCVQVVLFSLLCCQEFLSNPWLIWVIQCVVVKLPFYHHLEETSPNHT